MGGGGGGWCLFKWGGGYNRFLNPHDRSACDINCHKTMQKFILKLTLERFCGPDVAIIMVDDLIAKFRIRYTIVILF